MVVVGRAVVAEMAEGGMMEVDRMASDLLVVAGKVMVDGGQVAAVVVPGRFHNSTPNHCPITICPD